MDLEDNTCHFQCCIEKQGVFNAKKIVEYLIFNYNLKPLIFYGNKLIGRLNIIQCFFFFLFRSHYFPPSRAIFNESVLCRRLARRRILYLPQALYTSFILHSAYTSFDACNEGTRTPETHAYADWQTKWSKRCDFVCDDRAESSKIIIIFDYIYYSHALSRSFVRDVHIFWCGCGVFNVGDWLL